MYVGWHVNGGSKKKERNAIIYLLSAFYICKTREIQIFFLKKKGGNSEIERLY